MRCDSNSARNMTVRQRLVTTRHVDVRFLWVPTSGTRRTFENARCPEKVRTTKSSCQADADRCYQVLAQALAMFVLFVFVCLCPVAIPTIFFAWSGVVVLTAAVSLTFALVSGS